MAEFDIPKHGEICWRELRTKDLDTAIEFYTKLFGWELKQSGVTPMEYKEIVIGGKANGGMMSMGGDDWGADCRRTGQLMSRSRTPTKRLKK